MQKIDISVIVAIYNVEAYLNRCIDSLVNQTLESIEIILVNDCSPDNSANIAQEYMKKYPDKIRVINTHENLKQGGARNLGIRVAKGEYIAFVDADDWVDETMYEKLYLKARDTKSDIVVCDYYKTTEKSILSKEYSVKRDLIGELDIDKKRELILTPGPIWSKIVKRDLYIKYELFFPEKLFYEDNPFASILPIYANKMEYVEEALYYWRIHDISTSHKKDSYHHFDRLKTAKILLEEFENRGVYNIYKEEVEFRFVELYYTNTIHTCLVNFKNPELEYMYKIREYINYNFSNYRKNKYFKRYSIKRRIITKLNDYSPKLASSIFKISKLIAN